MTNPTEKIKKIEKELIALKGLDTESEPCWAFRDVEASIFKLEAKLQVYKEWEEREAEILEMIDKCRAYLHYGIKVIDFKELKSKIKGEKKE